MQSSSFTVNVTSTTTSPAKSGARKSLHQPDPGAEHPEQPRVASKLGKLYRELEAEKRTADKAASLGSLSSVFSLAEIFAGISEFMQEILAESVTYAAGSLGEVIGNTAAANSAQRYSQQLSDKMTLVKSLLTKLSNHEPLDSEERELLREVRGGNVDELFQSPESQRSKLLVAMLQSAIAIPIGILGAMKMFGREPEILKLASESKLVKQIDHILRTPLRLLRIPPQHHQALMFFGLGAAAVGTGLSKLLLAEQLRNPDKSKEQEAIGRGDLLCAGEAAFQVLSLYGFNNPLASALYSLLTAGVLIGPNLDTLRDGLGGLQSQR